MLWREWLFGRSSRVLQLLHPQVGHHLDVPHARSRGSSLPGNFELVNQVPNVLHKVKHLGTLVLVGTCRKLFLSLIDDLFTSTNYCMMMLLTKTSSGIDCTDTNYLTDFFIVRDWISDSSRFQNVESWQIGFRMYKFFTTCVQFSS